MNSGPIAVLAIGNSEALINIYSVTNTLGIPYISIRWDSIEDRNSLWHFAKRLTEDGESSPMNHINIHPPAHIIMRGVLDLITFYKWEYVTILFEESLGLNRIEDLIRLPIFNNKLRFRMKKLDSNLSSWPDVLKEMRSVGASHVIVDIKKKNLNTFFNMVFFYNINK